MVGKTQNRKWLLLIYPAVGNYCYIGPKEIFQLDQGGEMAREGRKANKIGQGKRDSTPRTMHEPAFGIGTN